MIVSYWDFLESFFKPFFDFALVALRVEFMGRPLFTYLIMVYLFLFVIGFITSHSVIVGGVVGSVVSSAKSESEKRQRARDKEYDRQLRESARIDRIMHRKSKYGSKKRY